MSRKKDVEFASGILAGVGLALSVDVLRRLTDPKEWTKFAENLNSLSETYTSSIQDVLSVDTEPTSTDSTDPNGGVSAGTE